MSTGDGAYIKKLNRSIILQRIIEYGMISRADLSKITGLNKATISVQVADLLEDELIYETRQEHHGVGRRPIMLSINSKAAYVLGIDLDYKVIHYSLSNLLGYPVQSESMEIDTENYEEIVQILKNKIQFYDQEFNSSKYGLVSVIIGVHGTVNKDEHIYFVPKYQWHHKNLKEDLEKELDIPISIENNANLSAYAERVYKHQESDNLLTIILSSGIGAGMMLEGELQKGYHGYAGEMGHMILSPGGEICSCGNKGCWERYNSEPSFFERLSAKMGGTRITYEELEELLNAGNETVVNQMEQFLFHLSIGLNNIINLYNPETIVLNSKVLQCTPNVVNKVESNLNSSVSQYKEIVLSDLGDDACVMGACALAIKKFLKVPKLLLEYSEEHYLNEVKEAKSAL
ncbi:ROK family protein [Virgibacillus sediminis]|uniref:ROK family protein n=1 Tax=Virgibacillus sediminis TaxID=202260 RepID=A0ABV7A4R4_9BACI